MRMKKINAVLSLLTIVGLAVHIVYTDYAYMAFYYNPVLKQWTSVPLTVLACLHALLAMASVFLQADGTRLDLYRRRNWRTIVQRISAALFFPILILHINTFDLLKASAEAGNWFVFALLMLGQPLFYADVLAHASVSLSRGLITLGWLSSSRSQKWVDRIAVAASAVLFVITVYAVAKGQLAMFLG